MKWLKSYLFLVGGTCPLPNLGVRKDFSPYADACESVHRTCLCWELCGGEDCATCGLFLGKMFWNESAQVYPWLDNTIRVPVLSFQQGTAKYQTPWGVMSGEKAWDFRRRKLSFPHKILRGYSIIFARISRMEMIANSAFQSSMTKCPLQLCNDA